MTADTKAADTMVVAHRRAAMALLLVSLVIVCAIRVRLAALPLERDEGEYAYAGQLALQGIPPFVELYNMKMPGIYWAYAAVMAVFGQTPTGIHLGLLCLNVATVLLGYCLARRIFDPLSAAIAASTYSWLSLGLGVLGMFAHAEHFVVLFVILGLLCLPDDHRSTATRAFLSGLFLGSAFTMKQHAAPFIVYGGACLIAVLLRDTGLHRKKKIGYALLFAAGVLVPFAAICAIMWASGVFSTFWFWTFTYARLYISQVSLADAVANFATGTWRTAAPAALIWLLALVGIAEACRRERRRALLIGGLLVAGLVGISPGFYYREHYYILLLPSVAALFAIGANKIVSLGPLARGGTASLILVAALAWAQTLLYQRQPFMVNDLFHVSRSIYSEQPFPESLEIGRYLREHSAPDDRIAILGSEPQILFYAQRRSATPFVYMYPLFEAQPAAEQMQRKMIEGVTQAKPKFVVVVNVRPSWLVRPDSVMDVLKWYPAFLHAHYRRVGTVNLEKTATNLIWDENLGERLEYALGTVDIFARKDAGGAP